MWRRIYHRSAACITSAPGGKKAVKEEREGETVDALRRRHVSGDAAAEAAVMLSHSETTCRRARRLLRRL